MILIGSKAIRHWFPDFKREPKDTDYIVQEIPDIKEPSTEYLINPLFENCCQDVLDPNLLYTLKMSHIFWDINWDKHVFDIQFLKSKGCVLDKELFYELYTYWNDYHGKNKRSDLKMSAEKFFDNAIKSPIPHDDLHMLLKSPPTYTKVLVGEVEVSEEKFNLLSYEEKCDLVTEEVMIMAFERYQHLDYRPAYGRMLKKFILSHAPVWEAIFIVENYIELHKPKFNYFKQINDELSRIKQSVN